MTRCRMEREAGFSLLEVLVAMSILSIGLLALALLQVTAIKGNATAGKSTIALQAGQDKLEWFRRQTWASIVSSNGSIIATSTDSDVYGTLPSNPGGDNVVVGGTVFYRVWRVLPNVTTTTLKTVTVWSCWQDDKGHWHNVTLAADRADI